MSGGISSNRLALRLRRQQRWGGTDHPAPPGEHAPHAAREPHSGDSAKHLAQMKEQLLRTQAEFDNFRKRTKREAQQLAETANKSLIESLLPALDNFERALANPGNSLDGLLSGIQMVRKHLMDVLASSGLERIEATGMPFDPHVHEAVATGEAGEVPDNHVMEVMQPGYSLKGKLIRPAMVRVARG